VHAPAPTFICHYGARQSCPPTQWKTPGGSKSDPRAAGVRLGICLDVSPAVSRAESDQPRTPSAPNSAIVILHHCFCVPGIPASLAVRDSAISPLGSAAERRPGPSPLLGRSRGCHSTCPSTSFAPVTSVTSCKCTSADLACGVALSSAPFFVRRPCRVRPCIFVTPLGRLCHRSLASTARRSARLSSS
jgi:hypothetical protein